MVSLNARLYPLVTINKLKKSDLSYMKSTWWSAVETRPLFFCSHLRRCQGGVFKWSYYNLYKWYCPNRMCLAKCGPRFEDHNKTRQQRLSLLRRLQIALPGDADAPRHQCFMLLELGVVLAVEEQLVCCCQRLVRPIAEADDAGHFQGLILHKASWCKRRKQLSSSPRLEVCLNKAYLVCPTRAVSN